MKQQKLLNPKQKVRLITMYKLISGKEVSQAVKLRVCDEVKELKEQYCGNEWKCGMSEV